MERLHALLVVLAPALASLVLCVVVNFGAARALVAAKLMNRLHAVLACREHVNTLIGVTTNIMFVGSAVGVLYGSNGESPLDMALGIFVGLAGGFYLVRLSRLAAVLAKNDADAQARAASNAAREALKADRKAQAAAARLARRSRHR